MPKPAPELQKPGAQAAGPEETKFLLARITPGTLIPLMKQHDTSLTSIRIAFFFFNLNYQPGVAGLLYGECCADVPPAHAPLIQQNGAVGHFSCVCCNSAAFPLLMPSATTAHNAKCGFQKSLFSVCVNKTPHFK